MLQKWKSILTNWINCYFKEHSKKEQNVNLDTLLSIISHLRENLNLDESTSSTLKAHNVEEFILEKYPNFKFENGTVEPANEEEIYIVASLLLFFVCVNSKDVDIKNAMCSKLSFADQEVIMKFSKCLMECTSISYSDVKTAIAEACGQESASVDDARTTITETPPVLRSLHSEVRRLQAALDAEKFDKNYLQEELARTNLKLEKLMKDKEQHKLDIVNLKAKISLCCGQEAEANGPRNGGDESAKLLRQLQQIEEKLVETQGQLDNTQYERDNYKAKIDELKQERDKWLTFSQQENSRVSQLTEELEVERRHVQSLRDLVTELSQHNQLNRLDTSQLECDDPDTSIPSVQNLSVCSEVCANVVEVQLGEERAKIDILKQQIQGLQDQLNDLSKRSEVEKNELEQVIFQKDNELLNLKHRVNEEIEENNHLKSHFSDEVSKLNNEINELEQKLRDNTEQSRKIIEAKMRDIQILQEEKLSLLQSLSNETTKLDNIIKSLKSELDIEKNTKLRMREEYENHIMKLNEKVLNRNNELVELQNKISEMSEQLEDLQSQLRNERTTNEEIMEKCNLELDQLTKEKIQIANMLQMKNSDIEDLKSQITQHIAYTEELKKNIETNQDIINKYSSELQHLEKQKIDTADILHEKVIQIEELRNQQTQNSAYIERLNKEIDDLKSTNQGIIEKYISELNTLEKQNLQGTTMLQNKDREIEELQNQITQHIAYTEELTSNIDNLKESLKEEKLRGAKILEQNVLKIEELQKQLSQNKTFIDVLNNNIDQLTVTKQEIIQKYSLDMEQINEEKNEVTNMLQDKLREIEDIQNQLTQNIVYTEELKKNIDDLKTCNTTNREIIKEYTVQLEQLKEEKIQLSYILDERVLELKESQIQLALSKTHICELNKNIDDLKTTNQSIINEYSILLDQLKDEKLQTAKMLKQKIIEMEESQKQYDAKIEKLNKKIDYLKENNQNAIKNYNLLLEKWKKENVQTTDVLEEKDTEIKELQIQLIQSNVNTEELHRHINDLKKTKQDTIEKLCLELDKLKEEKIQTSNILQQQTLQIEELQNQLTESNINTKELHKIIDDIKRSNRDIVETHRMELEQLNNEKIQVANTLEQNILKIKDLECVLTRSNSNIEELNNNIAELKASKQNIIENYDLELRLLKENKVQIESTLQDRISQINELQNQSAQNNVYIHDLNNKIKELNETNLDIVMKYNSELEQLKEEKIQTCNILEQKSLKIQELQNLLTLNNANTEKLKNKIEELKASKQDITEKYDFKLKQLKEEKEQISVILQEKVLKIEELQNMLTQNNASSEELNNNIAKLKATKQRVIEKYDLELQLLKEEKAHTENILGQNIMEKGELQNQLTQKNLYINELNNKIKELNATNVDIVMKYNSELEQLKEEKIQTCDILQQKCLQIEEFQNLLIQNNANTEKLNNKIEELTASKQDISEKYDFELKQLKEENAQISVILQQKDLKIEELQNILTRNNASSEELNKNIAELKATKQSVIEKYDLELQLLKQEKAHTENILEQNILEKGELQNLLAQNNVYNDELNNNIKKLQATKQDIIEKYNLELTLLNEEKIQMSKTLHEKTLEIRELQIQLMENKDCTEKLNKTVEDLKAINGDMVIELSQLKEEKKEAVNFLEQKVSEIKELTRNIDDLNARNQDIIEKYSMKLEELKEEKIQTASILQQKDIEIKELYNQLRQYNADIENFTKNIDALKITNEDVIKKYNFELERLKDEKVKADNTVMQNVLEIEKLRNQLDIKTANIEDLNKIIEDLKGNNEEIIKKTNLELEQLKEKNMQANNILEQKILELEEVQNQLIQNKAYIEELNVNMTTANQDIIKKYDLELEEVKKEHVHTLNLLQQKMLETGNLQKELAQNKAYAEELNEKVAQLKKVLHEKYRENEDTENKNKNLTETINELVKEKSDLEQRKMEYIVKITELEKNILVNDAKDNEKLSQLEKDNAHLIQIIEENRTVITNLEQLIKHELQQNQQLREDNGKETINLTNKCFILQEYQTKAEKELDEREKEITTLQKEVQLLKNERETYEHNLKEKDAMLSAVIQEKDAVIGTISKELVEEKEVRERCQKELEARLGVTEELRNKLEFADQNKEELRLLRKENEELVRAAGRNEIFVVNQEKTSHKYSGPSEKDIHAFHYQVDNTSDLTHSSLDSIKTISDLEKIIHDKNRTITTLQSDITYLKSLMADSENKLLDVTKELEVSKENCQQLSAQLKKIVHQKNEELADLKKQISKMSATENRATEIIKVSAKYQAIILKRISEIKSNTVLKELTNFGNSANGDNELRRSLNAGSITMEDLENFLETTDKHLKRCSEKQLALQKERDRLTEVNRINESEIINLKKFLTELSVSFKTFSNIKDLYMQKFSKVVSVQRTVRREILNLDGHITDATMCKLERGYATVMQDLSECSMNMERWVERCIGRTISAEKIKHAFSSDNERLSLASTTFQNTSLEIQLEELENSFQKLLEEVMRAQKGEGAKDAQAITVMEVRAEYEDKLNRMKAKMKQLYHEQIAVFQEKQKEEMAVLEREVHLARDKLAESSRAYEEHIRGLTTELWNMGEKFLVKKDEAEWLRRKQRSNSLMSLQHVHSSGLVPRPEEAPRPSDTHSLRSLPVHNNNNNKREGRGLHMSDEEGEVFDNRCLKELSSTPRRTHSPPNEGQRLSELRWRNSLCPPHLKSSYPAETQFGQAIDEDDIKCFGASGKQQRKEVGITAYKKPGPPTPSKQAGRLSATDSELRESLRVEADPQPSRKTSTPSRLRALFRSARNDTADGTPRTKRLSIFRKK